MYFVADRESSRPVSMFTQSKNEKVLEQTLQPSKSSGDLTETDDLVQDLKKIVEDKNEENGENAGGDEKKDVTLRTSIKEEVNNEESKDENEAKKPTENGDSKRSSDESVSEESNEEKPTDFESDVIMV